MTKINTKQKMLKGLKRKEKNSFSHKNHSACQILQMNQMNSCRTKQFVDMNQFIIKVIINMYSACRNSIREIVEW